MSLGFTTSDEIQKSAAAIIDPQVLSISNRFTAQFGKLKSNLATKKDWELQEPANDLLLGFVRERLALVSNAIKTVLQSKKSKITPNDLVAAYEALRPSLNDLQTIIWRSTSSCGIIIHEYEYEREYQQIVDVATAELRLLGTEQDAPVHPVTITKRFLAPDTNVLIHFKKISAIEPADLGLTVAPNWLFLEQVISELDEKAYHRDPYYSDRAKYLKRLIVKVESDSTTVGSGSTAINFFPDSLPSLQGLELAVADHRIILQAVSFQQANPGAAVTLATNDAALALRARALGFDILEFPEALRRRRSLGASQSEE